MRSRVEDDALFSNVVKNALNKEEQSLDAGIRSKLTQMRFNAIDNALPQQQILNRDIFQWGMPLVLAVLFAMLLMMNFSTFSINDNAIVKNSVPEELLDEDTDEALEMYEWFYDHYG